MIEREQGMQSTRQEILDILKQERQATVEDLAVRLELTPMTIRHHLNVLQAQNLVMTTKVRHLQTVGRPRLVYGLTEAADDLFPQRYGELANHLLSEVKETVGPDKTRAIFERIAERIARGAPPPVEGQTFEERLEQVSQFMGKLGFLFTWEATPDGYIFANVNCPYRRVSQDHAEVCAMDTVLLKLLLGVEPKHMTRLRDGSDTCTCLLKPPAD